MAHLGPVQAAGPLLLRDADNTVAAWPAVRLLVDEQSTLTAERCLPGWNEFEATKMPRWECEACRVAAHPPGGGPRIRRQVGA